jgi:drug/metabolite transporter (DMT)-like permease
MTLRLIVLAVGVISASFAAIFIRLAEAPVLVIAAYRLVLASLALLPLTLAHSRQELFRFSRRDVLIALLSGAFLALHLGLWIASLSYTSVTTSVVLVTSNPIFVAIASFLLFGERLSRRVGLGIVICLAGAGVIAWGNWTAGFGSLLGATLALLAAISVAGYLLIGHSLRRRVGLLSYIFVTYSAAGLLLLIAVLIMGYPLSGYTGATYLMFFLLAFVPQLIGHSAINWSLRYLSATLITIALLGEPVGASLWAFLVLGEVPSLPEVVGGLLILGGIFLAFYQAGKRPPAA